MNAGLGWHVSAVPVTEDLGKTGDSLARIESLMRWRMAIFRPAFMFAITAITSAVLTPHTSLRGPEGTTCSTCIARDGIRS